MLVAAENTGASAAPDDLKVEPQFQEEDAKCSSAPQSPIRRPTANSSRSLIATPCMSKALPPQMPSSPRRPSCSSPGHSSRPGEPKWGTPPGSPRKLAEGPSLHIAAECSTRILQHKWGTPPGTPRQPVEPPLRLRRQSRTLSRTFEQAPPSVPWPHNLRLKQGLECDRGDVLVLSKVMHAVVGFDGRNEAYICWRADAAGAFDTSRQRLIARSRAHKAPQNPHARDRVPELPALDHTGRIAKEGAKTPQRKGATPLCSPRTTPLCSPRAAALAKEEAAELTFGIPDELPSLPRQQRDMSDRELGTIVSVGDADEESQRFSAAHSAHIAEPHRRCSLWQIFPSLASQFTQAFVNFVITFLPASLGRLAIPGAARRPSEAPPALCDSSSGPLELLARIAIVKPACWNDVQAIIASKAVTFDERGWKEAMTVRSSAWSSFVDRQRVKLQREIQEIKQRASSPSIQTTSSASPALSSVSAGGSAEVSELEGLVESMEDWKEMTRYSGKSISMASTIQGSDMHIHVLAFGLREDGASIDFVRLSCTKSVEVCQTSLLEEASQNTELEQALRNLLPSSSGGKDVLKEAAMACMRLLQRPDVAKYAISSAFCESLENDGVHLHFCRGQEL